MHNPLAGPNNVAISILRYLAYQIRPKLQRRKNTVPMNNTNLVQNTALARGLLSSSFQLEQQAARRVTISSISSTCLVKLLTSPTQKKTEKPVSGI